MSSKFFKQYTTDLAVARVLRTNSLAVTGIILAPVFPGPSLIPLSDTYSEFPLDRWYQMTPARLRHPC